jgi:hypothetical protein
LRVENNNKPSKGSTASWAQLHEVQQKKYYEQARRCDMSLSAQGSGTGFKPAAV